MGFAMGDNTALRLWRTLHEPRYVTALMVGFYSLAVLAGLGMLWSTVHPHHVVLSHYSRLLVGALLVLVGLVGAPSAWRGTWWLERYATIGVMAATAVVGTESLIRLAVDTYDVPIGLLTMNALGCAGSAILGLVRWSRVSLFPYAPRSGHKPLDVREEAAVEEIRAIKSSVGTN